MVYSESPARNNPQTHLLGMLMRMPVELRKLNWYLLLYEGSNEDFTEFGGIPSFLDILDLLEQMTDPAWLLLVGTAEPLADEALDDISSVLQQSGATFALFDSSVWIVGLPAEKVLANVTETPKPAITKLDSLLQIFARQ